MSDSKARREDVYLAILEHVRRGDSGNWKVVRDRFPEVPAATFWRYVRRARKSTVNEASIAEARKRLADHVETTSRAQIALHACEVDSDADHVPLPSVAAGFQQLNLLGHLDTLFRDIELLKSYALNEEGRIKQPHFFSQAISMHDRAIGTTLKCAESAWDLQKMWDFYDAVVSEVAVASPEIAKNIMSRLSQLAPQHASAHATASATFRRGGEN